MNLPAKFDRRFYFLVLGAPQTIAEQLQRPPGTGDAQPGFGRFCIAEGYEGDIWIQAEERYEIELWITGSNIPATRYRAAFHLETKAEMEATGIHWIWDEQPSLVSPD